jgi:hypothetical protein
MEDKKPIGIVTFPPDNDISYGQDMQWDKNIPSGIQFRVYDFGKEKYKLIADGYGNLDKPNSYGNGAIYIHKGNLPPMISEDIPAAGPWIKVSERLPEDKAEVLFQINTDLRLHGWFRKEYQYYNHGTGGLRRVENIFIHDEDNWWFLDKVVKYALINPPQEGK